VTPYRIKKHRQRAHHGSHMALVPFIDMLTMLVVFLLLHSSDAEILPNTKNIQIPQSVADLKPHETVTIMVTKDELLVNGRVVGKVAEVAAYGPDQQIIPELRDALKQFSNWPTYPQLYVNGELVGGCDIVLDMHRSGELKKILTEAGATA